VIQHELQISVIQHELQIARAAGTLTMSRSRSTSMISEPNTAKVSLISSSMLRAAICPFIRPVNSARLHEVVRVRSRHPYTKCSGKQKAGKCKSIGNFTNQTNSTARQKMTRCLRKQAARAPTKSSGCTAHLTVRLPSESTWSIILFASCAQHAKRNQHLRYHSESFVPCIQGRSERSRSSNIPTMPNTLNPTRFRAVT
jgi:hypothetical protein